MAFIGLKVPHETARLLAQVEVDGEKSDLSSMHITMIYLGKNQPIEAITKATQVAFEVTSRSKPFMVETKTVSSFPPNPEDGIPLIALIESEPLHALRDALTAAFDAAGVSYDKKFPEYRPHVTLAYKKATGDSEVGLEAPPDQTIPTVAWGAGEMVLWGGDKGDEKLMVTFPFALALSKSAMYRAFVRLARSRTGQPGHEGGGTCQCGGTCSCQAQKVAARFDQAQAAATTAVDPKKTLARLVAAAKKDWEKFIEGLGPAATGKAWGGVESRPMRSGYGPYELGDVTLLGSMKDHSYSHEYHVRFVYDHKDGTLGMGASSGPHSLESLSSRGTLKDAPARLKNVLTNLKEGLQAKAKVVKPPVAAPTGLTVQDVTRRLRGISLGPAGRALRVEFEGGPYTMWSIEPANRQRLDHYVGQNYHPGEDDDHEGWDEEGWEDDYAGPVRKAAQAWLDQEFGKGNFDVDVGEKGHVDIAPLAEGKKALGL